MTEYLSTISQWAVPVLMVIVIVHGVIKGVSIFDVFVEGAKEGLHIAVKIVPYLIAVYVAVGIFRDSGAIELMVIVFKPFLTLIGAPAEIMLVSATRTLSGPAALGMVMDIFDTHGPDSLLGRMGSSVVGSTDTTFYILAIYFASVGIKKTKYAIPVGLMADFTSFIASIYIINRIFG